MRKTSADLSHYSRYSSQDSKWVFLIKIVLQSNATCEWIFETCEKWGGCKIECYCEAKNMVHVLTTFFGGGGTLSIVLIFNEALCFERRLCFRLQAGKSPNLVDPLELFSVTGLSLSEDGKRAGFRNTVLH